MNKKSDHGSGPKFKKNSATPKIEWTQLTSMNWMPGIVITVYRYNMGKDGVCPVVAPISVKKYLLQKKVWKFSFLSKLKN